MEDCIGAEFEEKGLKEESVLSRGEVIYRDIREGVA